MYWEDCLAFGAVRVVRALHFEVKGEGEAPSGVKGQGKVLRQYHAYDMQKPYLRLIFGFIGITDIEVIHGDNLMRWR